jgi:hypothetical protein
MTSRSEKLATGVSAALACALVVACAVLMGVCALAQEARPPGEIPAAANPPATSDPTSTARPGLVDSVGRWFEDGTTKLKSDLQGAQQTLDQLADQTRDAAKDATGAVMGLPNARILPVRERCAVAANGGPDCQAAAMTACRGKGFSTGKSLDTQSEQKCPAQVLLRGRAPNDAECKTETFVTRALCQ